jgi:hypothetical protein
MGIGTGKNNTMSALLAKSAERKKKQITPL